MDRRTLLQWMVATGGLSTVYRLSESDLERIGQAAHRHAASDAAVAQRPLLTPAEHQLVAAASECIIPRTDTPGALDAHVADFVDVMLADWYPAADARRFRDGIAGLDALSRAQHRAAFAEVSPLQQAALVQRFDDEVAALRPSGAERANEHWFAMLKYLTVWGYCTSEAGMRQLLRTYPRPNGYDGAAPAR